MALSKFQKFKAQDVHRSQLKNAPYNPRVITEQAAKGLRKLLKTHGLVESLVWNRRTGNLVGGHQRIAQIDGLEKTDDYELTVSVIDVPLKQEKEINISLNNPSTQGEYDIELLGDLFAGDIDLDNTGFTDYDLSIYGISEDVERIADNTKTTRSVATDEAIQKIKDAKKESKDKSIGTGESYMVLTFDSVEHKENFLTGLGYEADDRYMKGEDLAKRLKLDLDETAEEDITIDETEEFDAEDIEL